MITAATSKPVLIVGAGPTGMTAALELARFGIPVRVVEKALEPATTSRAIGVQARTLELFERRGLAGAMLAAGHQAVGTSVHGGGSRLFRLDFAEVETRYPFVLIISQAETERVLREELARRGVSIERGVEWTALTQGEAAEPNRPGGGVTATLRHRDGSLEAVDAAYLISAEGAHSHVRADLGLGFEGKALPGDYSLGDFALDGDLATTDLHIFSAADGFMALFPMGGNRFRLIVANPSADQDRSRDPSLAGLQAIYDARSEIPARLSDLTWSSWFHINSRMVERLHQGRVFLGGDSAHIHSPAGAQGMNTGIQDMINLGWKLALVVRAAAAPELLDTYDEDRLPVIRDVLRTTEMLTGAIGAENWFFRSILNHVVPWVVETEFVQEQATTRMSQVALGYRPSSLSTTDAHHGHLRAGDRVPELTVVARPAGPAAGATRLLDLLDPTRFTLLLGGDGEAAAWHDQALAAIGDRADLIRTERIAAPADPAEGRRFAECFGSRPALVLVRPDSYVGFLGDATSIPGLLAYLRRWLPPGTAAAAQ